MISASWGSITGTDIESFRLRDEFTEAFRFRARRRIMRVDAESRLVFIDAPYY